MPDLADSDYDLVPVDQQPQFADQLAPPSALASQVSGFPQRAADLGMAALGPIGEAGMTVGDMMRTGQVDPRDIPQVVGGVMMGVAAPEAEEAAPLEAGAKAIAKGITAYHGSPYDFDKFDLSKIGTGEGAQAYGHGLYFAENEKTAKAYADSLAQPKLNLPSGTVIQNQPGAQTPLGWRTASPPDDPVMQNVLGYLQAHNGNVKSALSTLQSDPRLSFDMPEEIDLLKHWDQHPELAPKFDKGQTMYQVSINADPEHFLDWDKPLSEQSPQVQQTLSPLVDKMKTAGPMAARKLDDPTGSDLHSAFNMPSVMRTLTGSPEGFSNKASAAEQLRQAGIPGIKYLDQGSRGSGNGTSNYVVFDDNLINIVKKYGMAGLIAGGGAHFATVPTNNKPDFGDQHFAKGGSVKSTKAQAHYHGGTKAKRCADCNMFEPPHGCSAVRGSISPHGVCDFFERKAASKAA